jgi:hypothetical protein
MRIRAALAAVSLALAVPTPGAAGDDENEDTESVTRVSCLRGTAELRLHQEENDDRRGTIEIELRVDVRRPVFVWRLVLVHERRMVYQGLRLSTRAGYALRFEREVPDWHGRQTVVARLSTTDGQACRMEATI